MAAASGWSSDLGWDGTSGINKNEEPPEDEPVCPTLRHRTDGNLSRGLMTSGWGSGQVPGLSDPGTRSF